MIREPVTTAAEVATLDESDLREGYLDGRAGDPEPGDNRSKAYWHGWRNGRSDREGVSDAAQIALIKDMRRVGMWPLGAIGSPNKADRRDAE
jgi:hypothetical protein